MHPKQQRRVGHPLLKHVDWKRPINCRGKQVHDILTNSNPQKEIACKFFPFNTFFFHSTTSVTINQHITNQKGTKTKIFITDIRNNLFAAHRMTFNHITTIGITSGSNTNTSNNTKQLDKFSLTRHLTLNAITNNKIR